MRCHLYIHISYSTAHNLSYVFFMYYNPFSLQGEDGNTSFDALSSNILSTTSNSWSYKSALSLLSKNDNENCVGAQVERTNVASIIAAARSNLRHGRRNEDDDGDSGESDDDDDEKKRDVKEKEGSDSSSGSSSSSSSDSSNSGSDDDSSSEDEVDDADQATSMESDVLKVRERPVRKKDKMMKKTKATEEEEEAPEKSDSEEEGGDKSSSSSEDSESDNEGGQEDEDEEELKEAAKAAAYFDNSSQHVTSESNSIDSFSQLGLSRPLLRGVASMGFVTPTLVQASVVPVALAGRDVCASAVTGSEFKFFLIRMVCMHQFFTYGLVVISISHVKWCTSSFFLSLHYSRW